MKFYFLITGFFVVLFYSCHKNIVIEDAQLPNILFAIGDDQPFLHAGAYGPAKGWEPGVAFDINRVKRQLTGLAFNEFKTDPPTGYTIGNDYARNFEAYFDLAQVNIMNNN